MPHVHGNFKVVNLVSNIDGDAKFQDTSLLNAWGLVIDNDTLWVASNHAGALINYDFSDDQLSSFIVSLTLPDDSPASPTGLVKNTTCCFRVNNIPCLLLTCTEDGMVFAYAPQVDVGNGILVIDNSTNDAIYKGLEIADNKLYVADFHNAKVDVFDCDFVLLHGFPFLDPYIPTGYAPFNIVRIGQKLLVSYAKQDEDAEDDVAGPGFGYVSIFNFDGTFVDRFVSQGHLNAPWAMLHGSKHWDLEDTILIGNFGDGVINVYSQHGKFLGSLKDKFHDVISIEGLWDLKYDGHRLYFAAGPNDEEDGLVGYIKKD